jgi:flagellar biogenesis protein FliO
MSGETVVTNTPTVASIKDKSPLEYQPPPMPEPPNFQGMMVRLGVGTIIVLGMCVGTLWGMRRWMAPAHAAFNADRTMRLIETLSLGNRCCLHLVLLGNREVLIGVDSGGIKSILPVAKPFDEVLEHTETLSMTKESSRAQNVAA